MQAKWLVQVYSSNPMLTASPSGYFTIHGTRTKKSALEWLGIFEPLENRKMRIIKREDFRAEIRAANHQAFNTSKGE